MDSPRTMITFKNEYGRFTYRIAGIAVHNGCVLFQYSMDEALDFWFLPGGRAELREAAIDTLRREMQEELGVEVKIERLLYVVENFFGYPDTRHPHHELGLYFLMTFPPDCYLYQNPGPYKRRDGNLTLDFSWLPIEQMDQLPVYPLVLREALQTIPEQTQHIVHYDE